MIAFLRGQLVRRDKDTAVIDVGGVGYRVSVSQQTRGKLPEPGETVFLHTSLEVREDGWQLFGFADEEEGLVFRLLRNVSGVGPRLAMNILSGMPTEELRRAILLDDAARLSRLPGIGKKTAQRLILELRDKVAASSGERLAGPGTSSLPDTGPAGSGDPLIQAREALFQLGYSMMEIQPLLDEIARTNDPAGLTVEEILRRSLRLMSERRDTTPGGRV